MLYVCANLNEFIKQNRIAKKILTHNLCKKPKKKHVKLQKIKKQIIKTRSQKKNKKYCQK